MLMQVRLNDQEIQINHNQADLVSLMKEHSLYHDSGIAVAINNEILPKQSWIEYQIKDNDNILIITATQGG